MFIGDEVPQADAEDVLSIVKDIRSRLDDTVPGDWLDTLRNGQWIAPFYIGLSAAHVVMVRMYKDPDTLTVELTDASSYLIKRWQLKRGNHTLYLP